MSCGFRPGSIGVWVEPRLPMSATTNDDAGELRPDTLMFLSVWVVSLPARTFKSSGNGVSMYLAQFRNNLPLPLPVKSQMIPIRGAMLSLKLLSFKYEKL